MTLGKGWTSVPRTAVDAYPLSGYQLGALLAGGGQPAVRLRLSTPPDAADLARWRAAAERVVARHPALHAVPRTEGTPVPLQAVGASAATRVDVRAVGGGAVVELSTDLPGLDPTAATTLIAELAAEYAGTPVPDRPPVSTRDLLAAAGTPQRLPAEFSVPVGDPIAAHEADGVLPADLVTALRRTAADLGVTVTDVLLAAHLWVVGRFTGRAAVTGWWVADARDAVRVPETAVGEFRVAVPVSLDRAGGTWRALVAGVAARTGLTGRVAGLIPLVPDSAGSSFEYRPKPVDDLAPAGARVEYHDRRTARYSLNVTGARDGSLAMTLRHPDGDAAAALAEFRRAVVAVADDPGAAPGASTPSVALATGTAPTPSAHDAVFAWAERDDPVALVDGARPPLHYSELRTAALALATRLRTAVVPEQPVGVYGPRSAELVIALFGVLAAGAVAVPLDVEYPPARSALALSEAQTDLLLLIGDTAAPPGYSGRVWRIDAVDLAGAASASGFDPPPVLPARVAYTLYTSGSTGRPKGVDVTHGGLANLTRWSAERLGIGPADRVAQRTPVAFDAGLWEIFAALGCGATVVVLPSSATREPAVLERELRDREITVLQMVPGLVSAHIEANVLARCPRLRLLLCGGERLSRSVVSAVAAQSQATVVNVYGPTECTVDAAWWAADPGTDPENVPIGVAVDGLTGHVLDEIGQPVPRFVPGELYLGGPQVARGYRGQPGLTADRFVPDPFGAHGARLYRTGDRVVAGRDGVWQYLGRSDDQVKLSGMRVELGEIERALTDQPGVRTAAVTVGGAAGAGSGLVAHVVPNEGSPTVAALRSALGDRLPAAMVPTNWRVVTELPLLPSGKVDRARLARQAHAARSDVYRPPASDIEARLAHACATVLGLDAVGRDDDLAALGLDQLGRLRVAALFGREAFAEQIPAVRTVADLAVAVSKINRASRGE